MHHVPAAIPGKGWNSIDFTDWIDPETMQKFDTELKAALAAGNDQDLAHKTHALIAGFLRTAQGNRGLVRQIISVARSRHKEVFSYDDIVEHLLVEVLAPRQTSVNEPACEAEGGGAQGAEAFLRDEAAASGGAVEEVLKS